MDDLTRTRELLITQIRAMIVDDPIKAVSEITTISREASALLPQAVGAAARGSTWADIGDALGVSKQAAHQRFKAWAEGVTTEIKSEHGAMKQARRAGDTTAARAAKSRRDTLVADLKNEAKNLKKR